MKKMNFKLKGIIPRNTQIFVDDKLLKTKKDKFGNKIIEYQTEKDKVIVRVFKFLELDSKAWFWLEMLYFFLTLFGIFDVRLDKKCLVLDSLFEFDTMDGAEVTLKINKFEPEGKAVLVESNVTYIEKKNQQHVDVKAKEKLKKLKIAKIVSLILIAVIATVLVVLF